jgi:hypothetical protein
VQAGDSQFANFEALDFCAADDQPANPDKPERQCTYGNSADSDCADRLRPTASTRIATGPNVPPASSISFDFISLIPRS